MDLNDLINDVLHSAGGPLSDEAIQRATDRTVHYVSVCIAGIRQTYVEDLAEGKQDALLTEELITALEADTRLLRHHAAFAERVSRPLWDLVHKRMHRLEEDLRALLALAEVRNGQPIRRGDVADLHSA